MFGSILSGAAALTKQRRLPGRRWLLLALAALCALVFAGTAYAAYTYYYVIRAQEVSGFSAGDNTLYYRNFNDACSVAGYGWNKAIYADGNGSWVASVESYDACGYSKAHLLDSSSYGITYAEAKCDIPDSPPEVETITCDTTRPDGAAPAGVPNAQTTSDPGAALAAFSSSATASASSSPFVGGLAQDVGRWPAGTTDHAGTAVTSDARTLISDVGTARDTLAAFPTTSGEVCYEIEGSGSCGFLDGRAPYGAGIAFSIAWDRASGTTRIFGVVGNQVNAVDVEIGGVEYPATLSNNGFYYQLPSGDSSDEIQHVTATWSDGSVHSFPVS